MVENVGLLGVLATVGIVVGRVLVLAIALRGTQPSQRPAIIRALTDFARPVPRTNRSGLVPRERCRHER